MKQLQRKNWVGCLLLAGLAFACGSEPGLAADELEPVVESDSDVATDLSDIAAAPLDVDALKAAPVTDEEMAVLDDYIARSNAGEPTSIEGRLVRWDDVWATIDDVLVRAENFPDSTLVEKGYVSHAPANPVNSTSLQFWRPDIGFALYYIIVQDAVPSYVFTAVGDVINEWVSADVDCLGVGGFTVVRQSTYNALSAATKAQSYEINFNFVPIATTPGWPCGSVPNGPKACARIATPQTITVGGQSVSRMANGHTIHFDSGTFPSNNVPKLKRILRHEFGHTFGFDHQLQANILIPGTQSCGQCLSEFESVMASGGRDSFTADDKKMLRTLYANVATRANDDCAYVDGFRTLTAL